MMLWLDAQLSPALALWVAERFELDTRSAYGLGLRGATDREIFEQARLTNATVMTKDRDFVDLLDRHGPPPKVIWITAGNTSNANMKLLLEKWLTHALDLLESGEPLVEIRA
ncbi:MAG: DUF5615 family PIN-like protein [Campylobacterales bacterium]